MKHLELHILQSFPVVCLNRDDLNSPKTAIFGGVQRARVSSQSWKRAIRELMKSKDTDCSSYFQGLRTRLLREQVKNRLIEKEVLEKEAGALSDSISHYIANLDPKHLDKVKTMVFFSEGEINILADILVELDDVAKKTLIDSHAKTDLASDSEDTDEEEHTDEENKKGDKKITAKQFFKISSKILKGPTGKKFRGKDAVKIKDAADIALFGRMVANDPTLNLEGVAMFAHALTTHKVDNEIDFFSAIDDRQSKEITGAGMTGTLEFNSGVYYRFAAINLDMLKDEEHLASLTQQERRQVLQTFIEATLKAIPIARQNSMNGFVLPGYVLGIVREKGHPVQLINAFEKPIRSNGKGIMDASIEALKQEHAQLNNTWGLSEKTSVAIPEKNLTNFLNDLVQHVD